MSEETSNAIDRPLNRRDFFSGCSGISWMNVLSHTGVNLLVGNNLSKKLSKTRIATPAGIAEMNGKTHTSNRAFTGSYLISVSIPKLKLYPLLKAHVPKTAYTPH